MQPGANAAAGAAAVAIKRKRIAQKIVADLRDKGAVAEARAVDLAIDSRRRRSVLDKLMGANVIRRTPTGLYWLDEPALVAHAKREATRSVWVLAALFAILIAVLLLAFLKSTGS